MRTILTVLMFGAGAWFSYCLLSDTRPGYLRYCDRGPLIHSSLDYSADGEESVNQVQFLETLEYADHSLLQNKVLDFGDGQSAIDLNDHSPDVIILYLVEPEEDAIQARHIVPVQYIRSTRQPVYDMDHNLLSDANADLSSTDWNE